MMELFTEHTLAPEKKEEAQMEVINHQFFCEKLIGTKKCVENKS